MSEPSTKSKRNIPFVSYLGFSEENGEDGLALAVEEYLALGQQRFTLTSGLMTALIERDALVRQCRSLVDRYGVSFLCAHGEWGPGRELSLPFDGDRKDMLERVRRSIELTAEFGGKVLALHAETWSQDGFRPRTLEQWRSYIDDGLEQMLPVAEVNDVVLCLENIWSQVTMPGELNGFVRRFPSRYFGLCFDAGHAHVMSASGSRACSWMPWACRDFGTVPWNDSILDEMLPNIVMTHLHDNSTDTDSHDLPGNGTIDWSAVTAKLAMAPRLQVNQDEVATSYGYTAKAILEAFAAHGFQTGHHV